MIAAYVAIGGAVVSAAAFFYGMDVGADREVAAQERTRAAVQETRDLAQQGAAKAIADMEIKNVTITQPIRTEVRTRTVYAECKHTPDGVRALNSAITGRAEPVGGGELPRPAAPADGR